MSLGLSQKFNVLQQSPHDLQTVPLENNAHGNEDAWVSSRFTMRARATDGRLVLWNSYTGAISVFRSDQYGAIESMLSRQGVEGKPEGILKYMVDRGFLVKKGTDEYKRFQYDFGQAQHRSDFLDLILLASEDCNFRCIYCYEKFARGTMRPEIRQGIKRFVESRLKGLRVLTVGWFGGEPLYGLQAIEDLAPFFWNIAEENSLVFHSNMTTNGYLLTPEISERLLSWRINRFQITLDGPGQCHDHSRPTREGDGTFDVILENLKALRQRPERFQVNLRVNFSPENVPHMDEFLDIVEKELEGDSRFHLRFRAVGKWGGDNDNQLEVCGADEGNKLMLEFERQAQERGITLADGFKASSMLGSQVCYAGRPYSFVVGASGKLMKCTVVLDEDERNVVGRITPEGKLEVDLSKLAPWVAPYFEQDTQCQRCVVLPVCQGFSCQLPRVTGERRPCIPTRSNWKKELIATVSRTGQVNRRVV
ncbi:MAG: radical SAM protein [Thermoanaerobaculia bacterium]